MDALTLALGGVATVILGAIGIAIKKAIELFMGRWQAREELKTQMQVALDKIKIYTITSSEAAKAVEQKFPDLENEKKKALAMNWTNKLNALAGVEVIPEEEEDILVEAGVLPLPDKIPSAKRED